MIHLNRAAKSIDFLLSLVKLIKEESIKVNMRFILGESVACYMMEKISPWEVLQFKTIWWYDLVYIQR